MQQLISKVMNSKFGRSGWSSASFWFEEHASAHLGQNPELELVYSFWMKALNWKQVWRWQRVETEEESREWMRKESKNRTWIKGRRCLRPLGNKLCTLSNWLNYLNKFREEKNGTNHHLLHWSGPRKNCRLRSSIWLSPKPNGLAIGLANLHRHE